MKRSQKEIKMLCDEISLAVKLALLKEEREKSIREIQEMQHEFTLFYDPLSGSCFRANEKLIKAQIAAINLQMKLEDYRKSIETL